MFLINDYSLSQILAAEKDFLVIYKPPCIHSSPLKSSKGDNILTWCLKEHPEITSFSGRRTGEGGLLQRLDFQTQGLMLAARSKFGLDVLLEQQKNNLIVKEYCAIVSDSKTTLQGFPASIHTDNSNTNTNEKKITSAFRPYGQGRKAVRPVLDINKQDKACREFYLTEILKDESLPSGLRSLQVRIFKGFRHQIRCHLAWLGFPIINDALYGGASFGRGLLGLRACMLSFLDPSTAQKRCYSIPCIKADDI